MKSALEELKAGKASAATCAKEVKEAAPRVEKGVTDAKAAVSEKLDDGMVAARRLLKRSRYIIEDKLEEAAHAIKQHPFRTLAVGFAAGALLGFLVPRPGRK
jgi:ElaB/YqjD/DUF883 family membrane-anchored ribosome-binding protein